MAMMPIDIKKANFSTTFRGYSKEEVDAFFDTIAEQYRELIDQNSKLETKVNELQRKVQEQEQVKHSIETAAIAITETLEEVRTKARKEADFIIQQAKFKSEEIIQDSHKKVIDIEKQLEDLKKEKYLLIKKLKNFIDIHRDILYSFENDN